MRSFAIFSYLLQFYFTVVQNDFLDSFKGPEPSISPHLKLLSPNNTYKTKLYLERVIPLNCNNKSHEIALNPPL